MLLNFYIVFIGYETRKIDLIHQTSRPIFDIQKIPGRIGNGNHISV